MLPSSTPTSESETVVARRPRRVLVLHQHYWPEIAATAQILTDLCEDLAARGDEVTVVCGQPSYRTTDTAATLPVRETHRGVRIRRVWSYLPNERTIPKRLLHYGTYFGTSLLQSLSGYRPDACIVMSTPPLLLGMTGTLLRGLRGVPFIYSVQDLYPDIAIHLGVLREDTLLTQAINQAAKVCYRSAAALVALSPGMGERLAAKGVPAERIHVIPNWADTSAVNPMPRDNAFAREHKLVDEFVVQYSGNLGLSQGLESLVAAAELLRDLPVKFVLVGDGNARAALQRAAIDKGLQNVVFLPPQPRERLSELLSACDVGLVTMKRGVGGDLVPSKLYGIMAASRPVLAAVERRSEVARVIDEHRCGWLVDPEDATSLANGIRLAYGTAIEARNELGNRGREACAHRYSRASLTRRYGELVELVTTD